MANQRKLMTLTLIDRSITYPYGVLEDVLVKGDELLFLTDFIILGMVEESETQLLLGRPFLTTGKYIIDLEFGDLTLRFNMDKFIFKVFESRKPQKENPQFYRIFMMEEVGQDVNADETHSSPIGHFIINSVEHVKDALYMEMAECLLQH